MDKNIIKQFEFDNILFNEKDTYLIYAGIIDMVYFVMMLFGCIMPISVNIITTASVSSFLAMIAVGKCAFIKQDLELVSQAKILSFFPTSRRNIRISRYVRMLKMALLQLLITGIPMIMFFYFFDIMKFMASIITVIVTMSLVAIIGIEYSLSY